MRVLDPNRSYTFSKIFELRILSDELASELGYSLTLKRLDLPQYQHKLERLEDLHNRIEAVLPYVDLASETSRREVRATHGNSCSSSYCLAFQLLI